ncbi:GDSL-type esterase/lipase family protein [Haploplasma modicum]|uniref:GDSL-type esterase/lipase family protein n=1 Tax=Haploplasma modicum TaxID=2150 RepID=UPI00214C691F|nr:GDSL-type esterase/lipase family protein [Haploplasma modicum]MCR1809047.1 GDSL-type esterase/lipase family protein [Haploplasma modicum]
MLEAIMKSDYKNKVNLFDSEVVMNQSIVFLGDSIIAFYKTNEYFNNLNILNRGIAGDTAVGILDRLEQIKKIKPSVVIISVGSNDIVRTKDSLSVIVSRILKIKEELESSLKHSKIYILSLSPVLRDHEITNNLYMKHRTNDIIDSINQELAKNTTLINVNEVLKDENNNLKLAYTTDGLHLTKLGYEVFSKKIALEVKELELK